MSCVMDGGDPSLCDGCLACTFAHHPPGMLCREQRTALTTRVRCESKRDMGQVALRLQNTSSPKSNNLITNSKVSDDRWRSSPVRCCDINSPLFYSSHPHLQSSPFTELGPSSSSSSLICNSRLVNNCTELISNKAVSLPSEIERECRATRRRSDRSHRIIVPKLSEVFIWLCVFCVIYPGYTRGAPVSKSSSHTSSSSTLKMMESFGKPSWVNPCGLSNDETVMHGGVGIPALSDSELLNQIIIVAKNALSDVESIKHKFVKNTFQREFEDHHKDWMKKYYDWLPTFDEIPKRLGEEVSVDHLDGIKDLNATLINAYEHFQKFAVGLEQVAFDHQKDGSEFKDRFDGARFKLRAVLCEIQMVINELGGQSRADVSRSIMDDQYRNLPNKIDRFIRDWIIFRDYMNALEYYIKVFEYYNSKQP